MYENKKKNIQKLYIYSEIFCLASIKKSKKKRKTQKNFYFLLPVFLLVSLVGCPPIRGGGWPCPASLTTFRDGDGPNLGIMLLIMHILNVYTNVLEKVIKGWLLIRKVDYDFETKRIFTQENGQYLNSWLLVCL